MEPVKLRNGGNKMWETSTTGEHQSKNQTWMLLSPLLFNSYIQRGIDDVREVCHNRAGIKFIVIKLT